MQTFRAYENGTLDPAKCPKNWYKCTVNGKWSKPVQLLQAFQVSCTGSSCVGGTMSGDTHTHSPADVKEKLYQIAAIYVKGSSSSLGKNKSYWYISNGYAAYTVYPKQEAGKTERTYQAFDVIGRFKHRSAKQNYYYYWLGESHSANMGFDTDNYTDLRLRFDDNDEYHKRVLVDVDLPVGQDKVALVFMPRLGEWKMFSRNNVAYDMQFSGLISAANTFGTTWGSAFSGIDRLTGIQMVGSTSLSSGVFLDTPAWNITFEEGSKPSSFWLGNEESKMYQDSLVFNPADGGWYDPSKYAHNFNTIKYTGTKATEVASNLKGQSDPIVTSVQCHYSDLGAPEVYPRTAISWSGVGGKTVTFGIAAGNIIDTKAYAKNTGKCPLEIGDDPNTPNIKGDPVIWMNDFGPDGQGYTYDGEPIELMKEKTEVKTKNEFIFTDAEVRKLLDVVGDLDYTFYKAEGTWTQKPPSGMHVGERLDGIPIDSDDYYLIVSVPPSNPYFTGQTKYFVRVFAKPIPLYGAVAKDKNYDGKTTVEWDLSQIRWGDNSKEEFKVYDRDVIWSDPWWIERIDAEFEDAAVGENKKIVGLKGKDGEREDIDIIHCINSPRDNPDRHWRNYVPYLPTEPTASIKKVPANTENALAPPEAEAIAATSITLKEFPYAVADTDQAPDAASALWQASPDFSGLADGSEHYLFARITGGKNYHDAVSPGALYVSSSSHSHNWDSANWTTDAAAHWHECRAEDCPIKDNAKKNGYGLHRFTQWAEDPDTGGQSRTCQDCGYQESTYLPMSQISMGTWTWTKTYYNQPDPVLSNLKTPVLQISAMDRDGDLTSLGYVCMAAPSDPAQFAESAWQLLPMESAQTGTLSGEVVIPENLLSGGYVYVRAKDAAGNVHYASTPKLVFDTVAPKIEISGAAVTSGQTYCTPQTAAVSDDLELASVTLDGKDIAAPGAIRLEAGEHTLVAVDKAGNRTTVTVRVNNGHTNKEWSIPPSCVDVGITITTCTVCGYTTTTPDAPQGHTWDSEYTVDREPTCTEQGVKSLHCTVCGAGKDFQTIPAVGHTLEPDWHKGASHHWNVCSTCGERVNEMSHQGTGRWVREPGRAAGGVEEHMECAVCGAIIARRYQPYSDDPYARYGTVEKQTEVKPGAPEAQWNDSLDAALEAVGFQETDLTENNNAVSHKLVLSISPLDEETAIIPGQTEIQQTAETQLKRKDAEFLYVDVSLLQYTYKEDGGNADDAPEPIHQTEKPLEIILQIPEELQTPPEGKIRTFFLLYAHERDGKMESAILQTQGNSGNGELHFSTDRFSTYAIAYVDTPAGEDPPSVITPTPTSKPAPPSPSIPISPSTPTSRPTSTPVPTTAPTSTPAPTATPTATETPTAVPASTPTPLPTSTPTPVPSSDPPVDHIDYIHGHKGQFRPNDYMSRAEAAQVFYRLLADKPQTGLAFDDVSEAAWYREPVSVLAGLGIVKGIGNHRFDPERPVTRGEFAAMAARFMGLPLSEGQSAFPDVPDSAWYSGPVNACESAGWIKGYPDGLFRPMDRITRAQAVTIVNRMIKRAADEQAIAKRTMPFSDVPRTHWAYGDILEAAVSHKSVIQSDGSEIWE